MKLDVWSQNEKGLYIQKAILTNWQLKISWMAEVDSNSFPEGKKKKNSEWFYLTNIFLSFYSQLDVQRKLGQIKWLTSRHSPYKGKINVKCRESEAGEQMFDIFAFTVTWLCESLLSSLAFWYFPPFNC